MKDLITLAYRLNPDLFTSEEELNTIIKPLYDDKPDLDANQLTESMKIVCCKLAKIILAKDIVTPLSDNLEYVMLDILRIVGQSYDPQPLSELEKNLKLLDEYKSHPDFLFFLNKFIFDAYKIINNNFIKQQNDQLTQLTKIIDEQNETIHEQQRQIAILEFEKHRSRSSNVTFFHRASSSLTRSLSHLTGLQERLNNDNSCLRDFHNEIPDETSPTTPTSENDDLAKVTNKI